MSATEACREPDSKVWVVQLLDLMEVYLQWRPLANGRTMGYLRIDGSTSLEDRCAAAARRLSNNSLPTHAR